MKALLLVAIGLALLVGSASAIAAPPVDSGTLTLLTPAPSLGQPAVFEYTLAGHVNECPNGGTNKCARIQVVCDQPVSPINPDGVVYGEAKPAIHPTVFVLGGGSSEWLQVGGPASCIATLYYWDFHPQQTFVPLASVSFTSDG